MYIEAKYRYMVWSASISVGVSILVASVLQRLYSPAPPYYLPLDVRANNALAMAVLIILFVPSILDSLNLTYVRSVERNLPRFLRAVTESTSAGMILPRALSEAAKSDYGPISREVGLAVSKFTLGKDFSETITEAGRRLRHPLARQVAVLISEAQAAGGRMRDVLESGVELYSTFSEHREERRSELKPYLTLVYISLVIYLVVCYVAITQFLAPVITLQGASKAPFLAANLSLNYFKSIFFWAGILESVFGGLVAGKISEGAASAGLKHSVILLILTVLFFNLLIF